MSENNNLGSPAALEAWNKPEPGEKKEDYMRRTGREWPYPKKGGVLEQLPTTTIPWTGPLPGQTDHAPKGILGALEKLKKTTPVTQEGEPLTKEEHLVLPEDISQAEVAELTPEQWQDNMQFSPIKKTLDAMEDLLRYKNKKYGNSSLKNAEDGIFVKQGPKESLLNRLEDKISRIRTTTQQDLPPSKNDMADLHGYITLYMTSQGWDNFDEFKD